MTEIFLDSMQVEDIQRLQTEQDILALEELQRLERINLFASALGVLITEHAIKSGGMLRVQQTNGVNHQGFPFSEVSIKEME